MTTGKYEFGALQDKNLLLDIAFWSNHFCFALVVPKFTIVLKIVTANPGKEQQTR